MLTNEILDAQREFEQASLTVGADRYHARQEQKAAREGFDRRDNVAKVIRGAIPIMAAGLRSWIEVTSQAKGRKPSGFKAVALLDADLLAYVGISRMFRELPKGGRITDIVVGIGRAVEVELEAAALTKADPKEAKRYRELAEGEAREGTLGRRHEAAIGKAGVELNWSRTTQAGVGQSILGVALLTLKDLFAQETVTDQRGMSAVVRLTEDATTALAELAEAAAWLKPPLQPMLTAPRPWTSLGTGCYHDTRLAKVVPLVKTYSGEHKKLIREAIRDGSMQEVLDAVNAIQETRWAIDERVLRLIRWCREEGLRPSDSFPASHVPELPAKLTSEEWYAIEPAKRVAMSRSRKAIRDIRDSASVDGGVFASDVETAEFLAEHEFFCLPHNLDFRGRVYAVPYFNHQRSDHMKGMFRFADAMPLGTTGGDWLMIHLANCGDFGKVSKKPFADRLAWVRENEGDILMCGRYPEDSYDIWSKADSPFCFLQACFEYDAWMQSGFSEDFMSTIAIAADGSCSGLQHYAALTRSSQEAHHVNLVPRDTVGDIYQIVADDAVPSIQLQANADRPDAHLASLVLSNGFGRSEVKRNVMTYFYGSGKFGMRDQHMEDTMRPLADKVAMGEMADHPYAVLSKRENKETGEVTEALDGGYSCAQVMASHTFAAVVRVAPKADEAANWIQSVADSWMIARSIPE